MSWDKNEDEAFPNRHPGEPGGLRQDILDEIADHLACAGKREREQCEDNDETIERRVLQRFGNPNTIARRLWWDQMRETVMREWIKTGVLVVVALAGVAGVVFMGLMLRQFGATNEAMLKALTQQSGASEARWATLRMEFRRGTKDGPLAEGVEAEIRGKMFAQDNTAQVDLVSGPDGEITFGPASPGGYILQLLDPMSSLGLKKDVVLFPKNETEKLVVVVPDVEPRPVNVSFNVPVSVDGDQQRLLAKIVSTWKGEGETWTGSQDCLFGPDGGRSQQVDFMPSWSHMVNWQSGRENMHLDSSDLDAYRHPIRIAGAPGYGCRAALIRRSGDKFWGEQTHLSFESQNGAEPSEIHAVIKDELADTIADWALYDQLSAQGLSVSQELVAEVRRRYPEMSVTATMPVSKSTTGSVFDRNLIMPAGSGDSVYEELSVHNREGYDISWAGKGRFVGNSIYSPLFQLPEDALNGRPTGERLALAFFVTNGNIKEFNNPLEAWGVRNDVFASEWPGPDGYDSIIASGETNLQLGDQPLDSLGSDDLSRDNGWLFLDVTDAYADRDSPAYAILFQWKFDGEDYDNSLLVVSAEAKNIENQHRRPLWLVLEPKTQSEATAMVAP